MKPTTFDRPGYNLNASVMTPCILIAIKHNVRLKLPSTPGKQALRLLPLKKGVGAPLTFYSLVRQHQLEITVADWKHQIPPHRPHDHLGVELPPFEGPILPYLDSLSTYGHPTASTRSGRRRKATTEPPTASGPSQDRLNAAVWCLTELMTSRLQINIIQEAIDIVSRNPGPGSNGWHRCYGLGRLGNY